MHLCFWPLSFVLKFLQPPQTLGSSPRGPVITAKEGGEKKSYIFFLNADCATDGSGGMLCSERQFPGVETPLASALVLLLAVFFFPFFLPTCANHAIKSRQDLKWLFAARAFYTPFFLKAAKECVCVCVFYGRQLPPMCKKYIQSRTRVPETAEASPPLRDELATHVPLLPTAFGSVWRLNPLCEDGDRSRYCNFLLRCGRF